MRCGDGMCWADALGEVCDYWKAETERLREALEIDARSDEKALDLIAHELRVMLWDRDPANRVDLPPPVGEVAQTILDALQFRSPRDGSRTA